MTSTPPTVIVVAPQGSGKTRHADALAALFGCTSIVDEWDGVSNLPAGALALAQELPALPAAEASHVARPPEMVLGLDTQAGGLARCVMIRQGPEGEILDQITFGGVNLSDAQFAALVSAAASVLRSTCPICTDFGDALPGELDGGA